MSLILSLLQEGKTTQVISKTVVSYNWAITSVVAVLVLAWVVWHVVERLRRRNAKRRERRQNNDARLKRVVKAKDELSAIWLRRGASKKIHAVGVGKLASGEPCIQVFVNDTPQMFEGQSGNDLPADHKGVPLVLIAMPQASFLASESHYSMSSDEYRKLIREKQDVIMGGISGANSNLDGECGTIGYFCRKRNLFGRKSDVYLLSNSHVFADLRRAAVDEHDMIMQPSPGEPGSNRPVAELTNFAHPRLENDTTQANFVDAAIAKLWKQEIHKPLLPMIGEVRGFVDKADVEVGEGARKFGRTTGFTSGSVFSIYLDIWVRYDRTGQSSFFKNQFLIEPDRATYEKFVDKGDSGSLVVDTDNNASGLIFAGANGEVELKSDADGSQPKILKTVSNYGVANPISEVMRRLNIDLL
ncbi:MAG: hypothetical protein ACKVQW_10160 [Pyrinomonadaceae bacterium]